MSARERILAAVRTQLGRTAGAPVPPPPPVPTLGPQGLDAAARNERFTARLQALGGVVHTAADLDAAAAAVAAVLAARQARSLVHGDAPEVLAVVAALARRLPDLRCMPATAARDDLLAADAGLTAATHGIAETGTLVLRADAERSRLASLVPPLHIALLPRARLLGTLGEALAALPDALPHAVTFVTGPSRTADIELQLVVGVHGPGELHVVLL